MISFIFKLIVFFITDIELYYRYRQMRTRSYQIMPSDIYEERIRIICTYANDIHRALWYNEVCIKVLNVYLDRYK